MPVDGIYFYRILPVTDGIAGISRDAEGFESKGYVESGFHPDTVDGQEVYGIRLYFLSVAVAFFYLMLGMWWTTEM